MALGINLVHLGVVLVLNMMIGLITPPYGVLLFIIKALNGIPLGEMIREIWLQIALLLIVLALDHLHPGTGAVRAARRRHARLERGYLRGPTTTVGQRGSRANRRSIHVRASSGHAASVPVRSRSAKPCRARPKMWASMSSPSAAPARISRSACSTGTC